MIRPVRESLNTHVNKISHSLHSHVFLVSLQFNRLLLIRNLGLFPKPRDDPTRRGAFESGRRFSDGGRRRVVGSRQARAPSGLLPHRSPRRRALRAEPLLLHPPAKRRPRMPHGPCRWGCQGGRRRDRGLEICGRLHQGRSRRRSRRAPGCPVPCRVQAASFFSAPGGGDGWRGFDRLDQIDVSDTLNALLARIYRFSSRFIR